MDNGRIYTVEKFISQLEADGLEIVPGSNLEWLEHPNEPGQWVIVVGVQPKNEPKNCND